MGVLNLNQEAEALANALRDPNETESRIGKAAKRLLRAAEESRSDVRSAAVRSLSASIELDDSKRAAAAAAVCGTLVEMGADPAPMEEPLMARLLPALRKFAEELPPPSDEEPESSADADESDPPEPEKPPGTIRMLWRMLVASYRLRRAIKDFIREEEAKPRSEAERTVRDLEAPAIAMFCASPSIRAAHLGIRDLAKAVENRLACGSFLASVFDVLEDEPIAVIEPSTQTGILARLSGVDVNFTLSMLLMEHFPRPDGQSKSRLSARAASVLNGGPQQVCENVTGIWNLYNWTAVRSDGTLPDGQTASEHWIWNEGSPADIAMFEGRRVILLGPAAYVRYWPAQRTFAAMRPQLRIETVLTSDDVRDWLEKIRMANTPSPGDRGDGG